jgi:hypothetical protein
MRWGTSVWNEITANIFDFFLGMLRLRPLAAREWLRVNTLGLFYTIDHSTVECVYVAMTFRIKKLCSYYYFSYLQGSYRKKLADFC